MLSFEQLIQTLTDTKQPGIVRCSAIAELVAQGNSQGIKYLVEALADSDSLIRREAAKALQDLNATSATEPLLRALQTESNDLTLWGMLEAIGEFGTPNALAVLESLLKVDSMLTRIEVKKSISRIRARYPDGTPTIAPEVTEPEPHDEADERTAAPKATEPEPRDEADEEIATPKATESEPRDEADEPIDADEFLLKTLFKKPQTVTKKEKIEPNQASAQDSSPAHSQNLPEADAPSDTPIEETGTHETSADRQSSISIEWTSPGPPVEPDEEVLTGPKEQVGIVDDTQQIDEPTEVVDQTEPTEVEETSTGLFDDLDEKTPTDSEGVDGLTNDARLIDEDDAQFADESDEIVDETVASDTESLKREEEADIKDLSESIAQSPRLAGSSVSLPVLAPSTSAVPYHPNGTALELTYTNFFLALLHPSKYLSKQWISRTRVYLILWAVLIAGVVGFIQHQKHFRAEPTPFSRIGLNADELPELIKRSLAEGDFYIQEGFYRKAINSYELSRGLGALPIDFYRKLGFAYFKEGQYALAVEAYELFLAAQDNETPDAFTAEASLVGVYPLTSVGEGDTRNYETYNILGTAYAKLGRVLDAEHAYEQAIRLASKYGETYNNLARLYADNYQQPLTAGLVDPMTSPKLRLAEALAYTAVTLNPDVAAYHDTLGWILSRRGQVNKAMKTLERAIDLQKDAVEPHYHLAQVALEANERKKAANAIRNVFKLKPSFVPLHTNK